MTSGQLLTIVLAGVLTYAIRVSFLLYADRMAVLPHRTTTMLRMIPPAALAALVLPGLLRPGAGAYDAVSSLTAGAAVAVLVSLWRRDIATPLVAGMLVVLATRPLLG